MKREKPIDCHKCRYYYVTWDKRTPHGCRAMSFKSKVLPSVAVFRSSGMPCQMFTQRNRPPKAGA